MQVSCAQGAAGGGGSHQRLELPPPHCCGVAETLPQGPAAQHGVLSPTGYCRRAPACPVTAPRWWQDPAACCTCGQVCSNPTAYPFGMLEPRGPGLACKTLPSRRRAARSTSPTALSMAAAGCLLAWASQGTFLSCWWEACSAGSEPGTVNKPCGDVSVTCARCDA